MLPPLIIDRNIDIKIHHVGEQDIEQCPKRSPGRRITHITGLCIISEASFMRNTCKLTWYCKHFNENKPIYS